ncbi:MAG: hypothetical protein U5R30_16425 [Deltaproteobacteria bacterium]|nr:hypothetical protein [Deltaproteobacteria bacterium]
MSLINDTPGSFQSGSRAKWIWTRPRFPIRTLPENSLSMVKEKAVKHGIQLSLHIKSAPVEA